MDLVPFVAPPAPQPRDHAYEVLLGKLMRASKRLRSAEDKLSAVAEAEVGDDAGSDRWKLDVAFAPSSGSNISALSRQFKACSATDNVQR